MLWGRPSLFLPSLARAPPGLSSHGAGPRFLGQGRRRSMKHCVQGGWERRQQFWSWAPSSQPPGLESEGS